jgi:hypothetical protein
MPGGNRDLSTYLEQVATEWPGPGPGSRPPAPGLGLGVRVPLTGRVRQARDSELEVHDKETIVICLCQGCGSEPWASRLGPGPGPPGESAAELPRACGGGGRGGAFKSMTLPGPDGAGQFKSE